MVFITDTSRLWVTRHDSDVTMAYSQRQYITTARDRFQRRLMHANLYASVQLSYNGPVVLGIRIAHQCYKCWVDGRKRRFNGAEWCEGITHV